jgi:serine/threonine-protein kinase
MPGGAILFTAQSLNIGAENAHIEVLSLKTGRITRLPLIGYAARYVPTGHIVFVRGGVLYSVGFDPDTFEVRGTAVPLLGDLSANPYTGGGQFAVSGTGSEPGTLLYLAGKNPAVRWQLAWHDGSAKVQPWNTAPGVYTNPRFSPDGSKLAVLEGSDIFIHDLQRDTSTRLTSGQVTSPVWAPDGKHLCYISVSDRFRILWARSDGAGAPVALVESQELVSPWSFAPDGRLAYYVQGAGSGNDVWTVPLDLTDSDHPKPGKPELFVGTPANERVPRFSPDGHWIAYRSDESGRDEVYVRPFPARRAGQWQVSAGGGLYGLWSKNRRELFYETTDSRIMVVDYRVEGDNFILDKPQLWSEAPIFATPGTPNLDLAPDGRFVTFTPLDTSSQPVRVTMLLNFFDELRRRK